jgi:hypothetical protein
MKYFILALIAITAFACSNSNQKDSDKADMYEASELSALMREMVEFSKVAKQALADSQSIDSVPAHFYNLGSVTATRGEHEEDAFQSMVPAYLNALKGIERKDSQQYYYDASIAACKNCHGVYCGGPMAIIEQL